MNGREGKGRERKGGKGKDKFTDRISLLRCNKLQSELKIFAGIC